MIYWLVGRAIDFSKAKQRARTKKDVMCVKAKNTYEVAYYSLKDLFTGTADMYFIMILNNVQILF